MRLIPSDPDIQTIVGRIENGSLNLQPEFQRGEVWPRPKQKLLIDSILRGWYVPPIHVIRKSDESQEVLDGQQRLRAIADFVRGDIPVDGNAEPRSPEISALDRLTYERLPESFRRRFDRFPMRVFEIVDYAPEEPYELFFRLNQPTTLTPAEKRNAFFGRARVQIKDLTAEAISAGMTESRVGFANSRLGYEDIVARFVATLEAGTLERQISAARITAHYRSPEGFSGETIRWAQDALGLFLSNLPTVPPIRLNKATMHSWLCFSARQIAQGPRVAQFHDFIDSVERTRTGEVDLKSVFPLPSVAHLLIPILNDRSTSRVNDVASVLLRDAILWILCAERSGTVMERIAPLIPRLGSLTTPRQAEFVLLDEAESSGWGNLT